MDKDFSFLVSYNTLVSSRESGIALAAAILIGMYVLIIGDIYDRTLSALLASTAAMAVLSYRNQRPSMEIIMQWIDMETLMLLFSMMILVAVIAETGIFDYFAVLAYKVRIFFIFSLFFRLQFSFLYIVDQR